MKSKFFGFTLIEVMISLFILTIVGIIVTTGLNLVVRTHEHIENKIKALGELQLALMMIERDIQQIVNRPIMDENGRIRPAFIISDTELEFTRTGFMNPFGRGQRSSFQRVAYKMNGTNFVRSSWNVLDRNSDTKAESQILISQLKEYHHRLLPEINQITPQGTQNSGSIYSPVGVEIKMEIANMGHVRRLIPIGATAFVENSYAS
jgi:general secretion pathway protein J